MKKIKIKEEEILNELIKIISNKLVKKGYISEKYCNTDLIIQDLSNSSELKEKMKEMLDIVYKILENENKSELNKVNKKYLTITLNDKFDMSFKQPNRYSLTLNENIYNDDAKNWKNFYIKILKKLDENYNDKLKKLVGENKLYSILFSGTKKIIKKRKTKINGIYYSTNFSANDFLVNLRKLFKELGIDFKNLEIEYSHKKGK